MVQIQRSPRRAERLVDFTVTAARTVCVNMPDGSGGGGNPAPGGGVGLGGSGPSEGGTDDPALPKNGQGSVLEQRRGGPVKPCPGLNGQPCGAPVRVPGMNPEEPGVYHECLDRNKKWPFGGPAPSGLGTIAVVGGAIVIIGGIILAPEFTIPALVIGGTAGAAAQ